jgi:hypothetical protein
MITSQCCSSLKEAMIEDLKLLMQLDRKLESDYLTEIPHKFIITHNQDHKRQSEQN